ncbi:MAG: hypothetical protein JST59_29885 [Actinobacteria bacterium]|nr:hypothetical protein [Actinomycetota bacterium]
MAPLTRFSARVVMMLVTESDGDRELVATVELARRRTARVLIVGIPGGVPIGISLAPHALGVSQTEIRRESVERMVRRCRELAHDFPGDLAVEHRIWTGHPSRAVGSLIAADSLAGVVVGRARRRLGIRWAMARWRRAGIEVEATSPERPTGWGKDAGRPNGTAGRSLGEAASGAESVARQGSFGSPAGPS